MREAISHSQKSLTFYKWLASFLYKEPDSNILGFVGQIVFDATTILLL